MFVLIIILWEKGLGHSPFIREFDGSNVGDYDVLATAPCYAYMKKRNFNSAP